MHPDTEPHHIDESLPERLMKLMRLDKDFVKGRGNYLFYREGKRTLKVIDFAGGYGSLLLGHNHPELTRYASELLHRHLPVHAQLSHRKKSEELCGLISDLIGLQTGKQYKVLLANTGTEAVEAALKHLFLSYSARIGTLMESLKYQLNRLSLTYEPGKFCDPSLHCHTTPDDFGSFRDHVIRLNRSILKKNQPFIAAAKNAFHGKTIGSLHVTYYSPLKEYCLPPSMHQQNFFGLTRDDLTEMIEKHRFSLYFPRQSKDGSIMAEEKAMNAVAGIIMEPVLGEGGIISLPDDLLILARELATKNHIPLVFDEIQCGMFRTGRFLASSASNVVADYYLLGKALGGGLAKISAVAVEKSHYDGRFRFIQTSTFAEDEFSSSVAIKTIEIVSRHIRLIETTGHRLHTALNRLAEKHPRIVREIRGRGCMAGITFRDLNHSRSGLLQSLSRSGFFGYMLTGYLLNRHQVRAAPTLSDPFTLRLEPSVFITRRNIRQLIDGLEKLCLILENEDVYALVEYCLEEPYQLLRETRCFARQPLPSESVDNCRKTGFLIHYINTGTIRECEPSMDLLPDAVLEEWLWKLLPVSEPVLLNRRVIRDSTGKKVEIIFAGLGFTSKMAREALINRHNDLFVRLIEKAANMLQEEFKVEMTGLGQFTSILTHNGLLMKNDHMWFTTGNSLTVSIGIESIVNEIENFRGQGREIHAGIIGAAGNIASVYAKCISDHVDTLSLLGSDSPAGFQRAQDIAKEILGHIFRRLLDRKNHQHNGLLKSISSSKLFSNIIKTGQIAERDALWKDYAEEFGSEMPLMVLAGIESVKACNIVIVSTSQDEPFLETSHFQPGTLIYDISVPTNCTEELLKNDKGIRVIFGGIAELPNHESLEVDGLTLEPGYAYGCISETLVLGFERWKGHFSYGPVSVEQVERIGHMARKHGFRHVLPQTKSVRI